jgi:hypothetical protein
MRSFAGVALAAAIVIGSASGCSLYFGNSHTEDDDAPPDAFPVGDAGIPWQPVDAGPTGDSHAVARCEDGVLYEVIVPTFSPGQPGHGEGAQIGTCPGACQSDSVVCANGTCSEAQAALCDAPSSQGATCDLQGTSCAGSGALACPQTTTCGYSEPGASCTCTNGVYACTQLTPVAGVQASLVGKWSGEVTPPSFSEPYPVSLWIYPDGTYWAECTGQPCEIAFYYGGDGPYPDRTITVLSTSPTEGAWADIDVDFGDNPPNIGAIASLTVDATHLRFTYFASWFDCGQPFLFELTRQ